MMKNLRQLYRYRELLVTFSIREIKIRYKQTVLGITWAIIQPVAMMVVFTVIFSKFIKVSSEGVPYPIFSYAALLPWTFFATSLSFAIPSLINNSNLVTKIYFPREVLPIASVLAALIDFSIAGIIYFFMIFFYRIDVNLNIFLILPIMLIQIVFTLGMSLFLSAINIYYRDVRYALPLIVQFWMYVSPVIYSINVIPERFRFIYMLNPLAPIIDGYRKILTKGQAPDFYYLSIAATISLFVFLLAYRYFKKVEMAFADII